MIVILWMIVIILAAVKLRIIVRLPPIYGARQAEGREKSCCGATRGYRPMRLLLLRMAAAFLHPANVL